MHIQSMRKCIDLKNNNALTHNKHRKQRCRRFSTGEKKPLDGGFYL